jgi:CHASE2 domain-containing sensor protein
VFTRKGWWHWLRFALLLAAGSLLGHVLNDAPWLTQVRYTIYHRQMMMLDRSQIYPERTALVLLNDDDYWGDTYQSRTPLKRDVLAVLLDKLDALGVNTVALDVDLRSPHPEDPGFEFADRGIYLTPPTPRYSVLGHGRGLSEDFAGVGTALLHRGSLC